MCLLEVHHIYNPPLSEVRTGYKVMYRLNDTAFRPPFAPYSTMKVNEWYDSQIYREEYGSLFAGEADNDGNIKSEVYPSICYPCGFHVFTDLECAIWYKRTMFTSDSLVFKVEYTDIVASGKNDDGKGSPCEVAKRIKLIEIKL